MKKQFVRLFCLFAAAVFMNGCARPYCQISKEDEWRKQDMPRKTYEAKPVAYAAKPPSLGNGTLIVLDAGHGGKDFGTHSAKPPVYQEKHLTLATAHIVKNLLQQKGYRVQMTRSEDIFIPLDKRAEFANEKSPKLFVSLHYNSAPSKEAEGVEIYYYGKDENKGRQEGSKKLAETVLSHMIKTTDAKSRGVKPGNFAVIRETKMPAILVEGGFLTNEKEQQKLQNAGYLKRLAFGVAQGIEEYVKKTSSSKM